MPAWFRNLFAPSKPAEEVKAPLPSLPVPQIVPVPNLPPEAIKAAYELVAQSLRVKTPVLIVSLKDVTYEGGPIGDYEISVRRLDG